MSLINTIIQSMFRRPHARSVEHVGPRLREVIEPFCASRMDRGLREETLRNYRIFGDRVIRYYGTICVTELTPDFLQAVGKDHCRDFARLMLTLLRWVNDQSIAEIRWVAQQGLLPNLPRKDQTQPTCLAPHAPSLLLSRAQKEVIPALVLGLYAGLRPYEVCRIEWGAVNIAERRIKVEASVSKTRRARIIEGVPTILWALLQPYWTREGYVFPRPEGWSQKSIFTLYGKMRRTAGRMANVALPHDVLRHSFATYFVAITGDVGRAAKILGHCGLYQLEAHYDAKETKQAAAQYFHPRPILSLPAPASEP